MICRICMIRMTRVSCWMGVLALGLAGCVSVDEQPVFFDVELASTGGTQFTTQTGWTVTLDQAVVAVGPIYLRDEGLRFRGASHGSGVDELDETLAAEFIQQVAFDLTSGQEAVGEGRGSARTVDVLEPRLEPPSPWVIGDATPLDDAPAMVRGVATRDAETIEFVGELPHVEEDADHDEEEDEHGGEVEVEPFELSDGGTLTVVIDPSVWFAEAHFDALTQTDTEGRFVISPASQVGVAWEQAQIEAFTLAWTPGDGDGTQGP